MFYKVIKNNKVIDVLNHLAFIEYERDSGMIVLCSLSRAQGIVSSDGNHIWHVKGLYEIPVDGYETVELVEVDKYEYDKLKVLNMRTPEEIIDEYTLQLIEGGML